MLPVNEIVEFDKETLEAVSWPLSTSKVTVPVIIS